MKILWFLMIIRQASSLSSRASGQSNISYQLLDRQHFFRNIATSIVTASSTFVPQPSTAVEGESKLVDVYFGTGCFWHIQHEFVLSEHARLNRPWNEITSKAGYAGGKSTDKEGRVCYHNLQGIADYGKLGHGEVVGMKIPEASVLDFASDYFNMFAANGERVDPMDRGGEYRALIGLPLGIKNTLFAQLQTIAQNKGMKLLQGLGNEGDTYGTKTIYVYDTDKFPFYPAEVYHQYHNDFQSPPYGKAYNTLADKAFVEGRLRVTGCPDRV